MARVVVVGDGPAGLSAALFLARNGQQVTVFGQDETPMHYALLHNYLGIDEIPGPDFQARAREQVASAGAELLDEPVTAIVRDGDDFLVRSEAAELASDYVVLAGGKPAQRLATELGAVSDDGKVVVDLEQRTSVERLYAAGRVARPERSQAVVSAGAGAIAALDILSREAGKDVHDWDSLDG